MNKEDIQEIKEIVNGIVTGIHARTESKYDIINVKLDSINDHLERLNGKVARHEKKIGDAIEERASNRQKQELYFTKIDKVEKDLIVIDDEKIRKLEDTNLTHSSVKKFMTYMFIYGIALGGLIIGIIEFLMKT